MSSIPMITDHHFAPGDVEPGTDPCMVWCRICNGTPAEHRDVPPECGDCAPGRHEPTLTCWRCETQYCHLCCETCPSCGASRDGDDEDPDDQEHQVLGDLLAPRRRHTGERR